MQVLRTKCRFYQLSFHDLLFSAAGHAAREVHFVVNAGVDRVPLYEVLRI